MKQSWLLLPLLSLWLCACEEPFSPKAPFEPRTVVTCIVSTQGGYPYITATVSQTYDVEGMDPMTNTKDPCDTSAVVRVTIDGIKYLLQRKSAVRRDSSRYHTREYRYDGVGALSALGSRTMVLEVTTGEGRKLSAATKLPIAKTVDDDYRFPTGVTAETVQKKWTFSWDDGGQEGDELYFPQMLLYYSIEGDTGYSRTAEIPLTYIEKDRKQIPVYPTHTREKKISYDFAALSRAIASISAGDSIKSRYHIQTLSFTLIQFDDHLSRYYASMHGYLDAYSIRVDETTYSNINGGIGIFGSYVWNYRTYPLKEQYIRSFGYQLTGTR
ncbi:MAG: DUF4249 family protein [Acidobacteriota bacterium]